MAPREDDETRFQGLREGFAHFVEWQGLVMVAPDDETGHGWVPERFADRLGLPRIERLRGADEPSPAVLSLVSAEDLAQRGVLHPHRPGEHLGEARRLCRVPGADGLD